MYASLDYIYGSMHRCSTIQCFWTTSGLPVALDSFFFWVKEIAEQQFEFCLNDAIKFYNTIYFRFHVTQFEVLKLVSWHVLPREGMWCHLNFEAKPKNNRPVQLFFAEVDNSTDVPVVTICFHVKPEYAAASCGSCRSNDKRIVYHPCSQYKAGGVGLDWWNKKVTDLHDTTVGMAKSDLHGEAREKKVQEITYGNCFPPAGSLHNSRMKKKEVATEIPWKKRKAASDESFDSQPEKKVQEITYGNCFTSAGGPHKVYPLKSLGHEAAQQKIQSFSELAISYYNKTEGTEFELAEPSCCKSFCSGGYFWYHLNFKADRKGGDRLSNLSPVPFFAEVVEMPSPEVSICCILDLENDFRCVYCEVYDKEDRTKIHHPDKKLMALPTVRSKTTDHFVGDVVDFFLFRKQPDFALYSEQAVKHYNKFNGTEYEFVKLVSWGDFSGLDKWYHINFEAKLKHDESSNSPSILLFAEIHNLPRSPIITACHMLELESCVLSCGSCMPENIRPMGAKLYHPCAGYEAGGVLRSTSYPYSGEKL